MSRMSFDTLNTFAISRKMAPARILKYDGTLLVNVSIQYLRHAHSPNATMQEVVEIF